MTSLHYLGDDTHLSKYHRNTTFEEVVSWYNKQSIVQLDTETNVVDFIVDRELVLIQLSDLQALDVYVIQTSYITDEQLLDLIQLICSPKTMKIIQSSQFEYKILLKASGDRCRLANTWDTKVMEQCLYAGYKEKAQFYSLAEIVYRRLNKMLDKYEQTNFGDDIITDSKLEYAASDVLYLGTIYGQQKDELDEKDLSTLYNLPYNENVIALVFADMEYHGMTFREEPWLGNIDKATPIIESSKKQLNQCLLEVKDDLELIKSKYPHPVTGATIEVPLYIKKPMVIFSKSSSAQVESVLNKCYPGLELNGTSQVQLREVLKSIDPDAPNKSVNSKVFKEYLMDDSKSVYKLLKMFASGRGDVAVAKLASIAPHLLQEAGCYLPEGTVTVNWNSVPTVLEIFKLFDPTATTTDAEQVEKSVGKHKFFKLIQEYRDSNSLVTKYGERTLKLVANDNKIRPRYNTILSTGRVSCSSPNVQQIPTTKLPKERQSDYRNCFYGGEGTKIVSADYSGQELAEIATFSKDPVWLDALKSGKDLHSVCAYQIYKDEWVSLAEEGCKFVEKDAEGNMKMAKCNCSTHMKRRQDTKALNFGLAYGLGADGLANKLGITHEEAENLIDEYFKAFPTIKVLLDSFEAYGQKNGYIRTVAPFRRKRFFPYWKGAATSEWELSSIGRASKNMPIQGERLCPV